MGLAVGLVILFWGDVIISAATRMLAPTCPLYWRTMGLLAASLEACRWFLPRIKGAT